MPERSSPGGRVFAMATTGEVRKRIWIATSVSRNYPVSYKKMYDIRELYHSSQDFEIQVYGFKTPAEPEYLWSFIVKDSVLDMATETEGGRVNILH